MYVRTSINSQMHKCKEARDNWGHTGLKVLYRTLSVHELVQTCSDSCKSTALENRVTGEKGPETELELGTYALAQSFSHSSHRPRPTSFIPNPVKGDWERRILAGIEGLSGWNSAIEPRSRVRTLSLVLFPCRPILQSCGFTTTYQNKTVQDILTRWSLSPVTQCYMSVSASITVHCTA